MKDYDSNVYGYVNGNPVYSHEEYRYKCRGFGEIQNDDELISFATSRCTNEFRNIYDFLSDYALSEPYRSLTHKEFERLKYLQAKAYEAKEMWEESLNWKYCYTIYWADNSEEEVWRNGLGEEKKVMTVHPHGDVC